MKTAILPKLLFVTWIIVIAVAIIFGITSCDNPPAQKSDPRPAISEATTINAESAKLLKAQLDAVQSDKATLEKQNAQLQKALDEATATGNFIDKAQAQRAKAAAAGTSVPEVVSNLGDQKTTLEQANASNADLKLQLAASKADNKTLSDSNAALRVNNDALTAKNTAQATQLKEASTLAEKSEGEKAGLEKDNAALKEKIASGERAWLEFYFGISIALIIGGIAGIIWIPSPAKTVAYILATAGAIGLLLTIFLIAWMVWLKWIMLAVFVGGLAYVAWQLFVHHGALTKTAEGVQGLKEDLASLASSSPAQAVRAEASKIYTDYFGSVTTSGIFHWLHSEYSGIIARVRKLIGSPAAAKVSTTPAPFLTATVPPITPAPTVTA